MAQSGTGTSTPAVGTGLCTLAALKTKLSITTAAKDNDLTATIAAASAWFIGEAGEDFTLVSRTELFSPGNPRKDDRVSADCTYLRPRHYPVVSVESLHQDAERVFGADALIDPADYFIGPGQLTVELLDDGDARAFATGQRTVQLVYSSGYAAIPADVVLAALLLSIHLWQKPDRQKLGVASESVGGVTVSYSNEEMPKEVRAIVDRYKRPCGW